MTNRSFEEIKADLDLAFASNDAEALLRYATELDALDTPQAEASASRSRGWAHNLRGDYPEAMSHFHRALALHEELDDRSGVARVTGNIGGVHLNTGEYPVALEHFDQALATHEELGDRSGVAGVTNNIGSVYASTGDYPAALEHNHRALALFRELGNRSGEARVTGNIGIVYAITGDYPAALEYIHRAPIQYQDLGDRSGVASAISNIGAVHISAGDYPAALKHFRQALSMHEELGERSGVARATGNIVSALLETEQDAEAVTILDRQSALQMDDPIVRTLHHANRATIAERSGDLESAREFLIQALGLTLEVGAREQAVEYHQRLRDLAQKRNDFAAYIEHNNEYQRITEEIRGKEATQKLAMMEAQRGIEAERRERDKERALLYGTLPKSVADRMIRGEKITGDHYDNASVLFLDIVGFTAISDRIPPGHVVHLLSQIFSTLDEVCKGHRITKIKTIGDSYMAVAGVPDVLEDHAQRAALCATDMLLALNALEISMPPDLGDTSWVQDVGEIQVRIGIHCGPITAGVIGTERLQYDVWGDTVNVASRMENTSSPGRIHVSYAFANALKSERAKERKSEADVIPSNARNEDVSSPFPVPCSLRERGALEIKGKGTMTTYWLESPLQ